MNVAQYSVVVPVYNSSDSLSALLLKINGVFEDLNKSFEIVFVDDASTDNSWEELNKIKSSHKNITIIRLAKNAGQYMSTLCGLQHAKGNTIITIDDDMQYPPEEISNLIAHFNNNKYKIVYGMPKVKRQSLIKRALSFTASFLAFTIFKNKTFSARWLSSFRIFNRNLICDASHNIDITFHIETYLSWKINKQDVGFITVKHEKRKVGKSGNTLYKKLQQLVYSGTYALEDNLKHWTLYSFIYFWACFVISCLSFYFRKKLPFLAALAVFFMLIIGAFLVGFTALCAHLLLKKYLKEKGKKDFYIDEVGSSLEQ